MLRIQLDERLQNLFVNALGRLLRADVLSAQDLPDTDDTSPEFAFTVSFRRDINSLTDADAADIPFVNIHTHAQSGSVGDGED